MDRGPARRPPVGACPRVAAPVLDLGEAFDALRAEHGFACARHAQARRPLEHRLLFDTGITPDGLVENMRRLDLDPRLTAPGDRPEPRPLRPRRRPGSAWFACSVTAHPPILLHPDFWTAAAHRDPRSGAIRDARREPRGDGGRGVRDHRRARAIAADERTVLITGEVDRTTEFEKGFAVHQAQRDGAWTPDPLILDDQALIANVRGRGLVVLTGCGHSGIVNIVRHAQQADGGDALGGGRRRLPPQRPAVRADHPPTCDALAAARSPGPRPVPTAPAGRPLTGSLPASRTRSSRTPSARASSSRPRRPRRRARPRAPRRTLRARARRAARTPHARGPSRRRDGARTSSTSIWAAWSIGKPPTPVPKATRASDFAPSSSARLQGGLPWRGGWPQPRSARRGSIVAAWITQRAGTRRHSVATASPSPIGAFARRFRCWTPAPRAREIAPATPPPCFKASVGRIRDRVDLELGDVGVERLDGGGHQIVTEPSSATRPVRVVRDLPAVAVGIGEDAPSSRPRTSRPARGRSRAPAARASSITASTSSLRARVVGRRHAAPSARVVGHAGVGRELLPRPQRDRSAHALEERDVLRAPVVPRRPAELAVELHRSFEVGDPEGDQ